MKKLKKMETDLSLIVQDAAKIESPRSAKAFANLNISDLIQNLSVTIRVSEEWSIDEELIAQAKKLLGKLEVTLDLLSDLTNLQRKMPIKTQNQYLGYFVHKYYH